MIPILLTKEQKLRNIRTFYRTKLNLLNLHLDQKINELQTTINDISNIKDDILKIKRKCDL